MERFERNDDTPIYKQVYAWMKRNIITGKWEPGKKLPTEPVLSADLGISRQTLRHALQLLINDGLLYRQQGRGTFVQQKRSNYQLSYLESFTEQMQAIGKKATSKVIELKTNLIPEGSLAEKLLLSDRERMLKIVRLRLADGQPMSLEEVYIDINLCPNLHKKDLENQSLYTILEKEYGLKIKYGDLSLEARQATTEQAKLLQIKTSGLLLYMQCLTYLENGRPAFLTIARYPTERYIFTVSMPRKNENDEDGN